MEWYDQEKNIGYDVRGNAVMKKLSKSRSNTNPR